MQTRVFMKLNFMDRQNFDSLCTKLAIKYLLFIMLQSLLCVNALSGACLSSQIICNQQPLTATFNWQLVIGTCNL